MVNPAPFKAQIRFDEAKKELVIGNGLASRTLRLSPNAATVSLKNLSSGEEMLRAVSPEARVTLNDTEYAIGGLEGQRIQNYLKAEWIDGLRDQPGAYHLADWKELPMTERLQWKKRPEWLAKDLPWPAPGKHVVMRYVPPVAPGAKLAGPALVEETFGKFAPPDKAWAVTASKTLARASFSNEGKAGEIMALPDTAVYAERAWPKDGQSVELTLDAGDDAQSNAWGPGLALVAADGSAVHFIVRPNQQVFETAAGLAGSFDRSKPVRLRARLEKGTVVCEAAQGEEGFKPVAAIAWDKAPALLRIDKVGQSGQGKDLPNAGGQPIRCHLSQLTVRGAEPAGAATPRADLPEVEIHYEIFDGIPLFSKWLEVKNTGKTAVRVNRFVSDELRLCEVESTVDNPPVNERPNLWVETDYSFHGMEVPGANKGVSLNTDPAYGTQVNYAMATPCLLRCQPPERGPDQDVAAGASFASFRAFELLLDSTERERRSLAQRKMYRVIAPWTQENPLMFHKVQSDPAGIRKAIDQASETGFEMVIMSFGSGFNFESRDKKYWDKYKELAEYGKSKGVVLGGYSLLASRGAGDGTNTKGQPTAFGVMPCLGAKWGQDYLDNIVAFSKYAGLGVFENDGSYPGDRCAATDHPLHHGLDDSQWVMWRAITKQYKELKADGVFVNVPDWYFLSGANKCGMGYRETNWSLPRAEQEIIERQNMFDGTWTKTQSMGWMFVPLSQYHGGGAAATIEPLHQHLPHYEARFADLLGYGVQACYRGPQLYDTDETKALVKKWVKFYKDHREVLDQGDLIHLRRPDGRDWDGIIHVNPQGKEKALAFFYNPLNEDITREIRVPLHYAGLTGSAQVSVNGGAVETVALDASQTATVKVNIPAGGRTWLLFAPAK